VSTSSPQKERHRNEGVASGWGYRFPKDVRRMSVCLVQVSFSPLHQSWRLHARSPSHIQPYWSQRLHPLCVYFKLFTPNYSGDAKLGCKISVGTLHIQTVNLTGLLGITVYTHTDVSQGFAASIFRVKEQTAQKKCHWQNEGRTRTEVKSSYRWSLIQGQTRDIDIWMNYIKTVCVLRLFAVVVIMYPSFWVVTRRHFWC
jgi:hypothetical protein